MTDQDKSTKFPATCRVFVSYCCEDENWRHDFETHLDRYHHGGWIVSWSDQEIVPGSEWFDEIQRGLANSNVAVPKPPMWIVRLLNLGVTMLLILKLAGTSAAGQAPAPGQRVLVLYSDERLLPDPADPYTQKRVVKGGSFLCNPSYCESYRPSARRGTPPDTGSSHTGFRCVISGDDTQVTRSVGTQPPVTK